MPETEIEITDEMIDAGLAAWADWDPRFERGSSLVIAIYEAMQKVAHSDDRSPAANRAD